MNEIEVGDIYEGPFPFSDIITYAIHPILVIGKISNHALCVHLTSSPPKKETNVVSVSFLPKTRVTRET